MMKFVVYHIKSSTHFKFGQCFTSPSVFLFALPGGSVVTLLRAAAFCFIGGRNQRDRIENITIVNRVLTILLSVITFEIVSSAYAEG